MHRKFTRALTAVAVGAVLALAPAAGAAAEATPRSWSSCPDGWICFFSERDGGGQLCKWSQNSTDTRSQCSWMRAGTNTRSVWNRTSKRYHYYHRTSYVDRIGSTTAGDRGNLAGTYTIGSLCGGSCPG
ncbi:peptidase inhibitor family I36 protein [Kitasatospora sp. NPDC096147]|uniref:peptidase inhibitor family I36 protein n=1 Tax=Kitasatospora sp. NPDC096147 TaxID=3364093 RepID=UPI0037FE76BD